MFFIIRRDNKFKRKESLIFKNQRFIFNIIMLKFVTTLVLTLRSAHSAFLNIFFPHTCNACPLELFNEEIGLCVFCESSIELTYGINVLPEALMDFEGVIYSVFHYTEQKEPRGLIHALKYGDNKDVGRYYGQKLAISLDGSSPPECLIPVPLHPKKLLIRGYNQSVCIAQGLTQKIGIPIKQDIVFRVRHQKSQTKKSKAKRTQGITGAFRVDPEKLNNLNHIGLVDDVLTTGATLNEIISQIKLSKPSIRISIFVLAITK